VVEDFDVAQRCERLRATILPELDHEHIGLQSKCHALASVPPCCSGKAQ
jgi:hypothetical protein